MPRGPRTALLGALALLTSALFALVLPTSAHGAPYPPKTCAALAISTTTPRVGESITVSGRNFHAGDTERLVLTPAGVTLATVTVNSHGNFSTSVTMPRDAAGNQRLSAVGPSQSCPVDPIQLVVQNTNGGTSAAPTSGHNNNGGGGGGGGGGGHIPGNTGTDVLILLVIALGLIGAGVAFVRGGRGRRTPRRA